MRSRDGGHDASPTEETGGAAHTYRSEPERSTLDGHTLPPSRNETIMTTTKEPVLGPHAARVVERAGERDTIAERHFDLTFQIGWVGMLACCCYPCRTVSHNVNTVLLQCAPNLFNLLLIHTSNADATVDITITVLNNFELKRDTVQAENDFPAQ